VGRATWYKLSAIYTAVKRLAELDQEAGENMIWIKEKCYNWYF